MLKLIFIVLLHGFVLNVAGDNMIVSSLWYEKSSIVPIIQAPLCLKLYDAVWIVHYVIF